MPLRPKTGLAEADPAVTTPCGFDIVHTLSTCHQWFPCGPLLASHLTWFFPGLFLLCSRPWLLTTAAEGGLEPAPASRFRGTYPHRSSSYTHWALLGPLRSWRTIIGEPGIFNRRPPLVPGHCFRSFQHPVYLVEVQITEQPRNHPALRNSLLPRRVQQQFQKPQNRVVIDSPRHLLQHNMMPHRVEVGSQIKIDYVGLALPNGLLHQLDGSVR